MSIILSTGGGGHAWQGGVRGGGACDTGRGMHGRGACVEGGHAWQGEGEHAWQILRDTVNERAVRILLECILLSKSFGK